jgi:hypothetical protein
MANLLGHVLEKPPRLRRSPRIAAVRRSWLAAFWQARVSVRADVTLDDFLRSRLTRYVAGLPVPHARLPLEVTVDDGQLVALPADGSRSVKSLPASEPSPPAEDDLQRWLAPLVALEGPAVRQEVAELEVRLSVLDGEIAAARHRTEELTRCFAADVAAGAVAAPPAIEATAEQMGRPPLRSGLAHVVLVAFAAIAFLATTWQVALPVLRAADLDPSALPTAFERRPFEVAFVALFALGVAAGLFALADAALGLGTRLFRGEDDPRRRRILAGAACAAVAFSVAIGGALAALRPVPAHVPDWAFVLLLLPLPAASALLLRLARADAERRAPEVAAALAWDRDRARALTDRGRRLEEIEWAAAEVQDLERRREAARRRLQDMNARVIEAARLGAEAADRERADLARLAQSLVAALDLDRFEFIRQASARGAAELIAPRNHKIPAGAPAAFDADAPAEGGRLHS